MDLKRELGFVQATSLGIGGILGAGIFVLSGVAISQAGPSAIVSFAIGALLSLFIGFSYMALSKAYPGEGGAYHYAKQSRGPHYGYITGWIYFGAWIIASGYVTLGFGEYVKSLTGFPAVPTGILLIVLLTSMNLMGVKLSGRLQTWLVVIELILLTIVIAVSFGKINFAHLQPFMPNGTSAMLAASLLGFLSLTGWDVIAVASKEIRNAERNVPLSIITSILVVTVIYLGLLYVMVGIFSYDTYTNTAAPVVLAVSEVFGSQISVVLIALIVSIALAATTNSFIMVTSRTLFSLSEDGGLPAFLRKVNKNGVPWVSILLVNAMKISVLILGNLHLFAQGTGFLYLVSFILTLLCLPPFNRKFKIKVGAFSMAATVISVLVAVSVLIHDGKEGVLYGVLWTFAGIVIYVLQRRRTAQAQALVENEYLKR